MATLRAVQQPGLHWEHNLFSDAPAWSKEPSIDVIEKIACQYSKCSLEHVVSEAIRGQLFTGDHIQLDIYRGPYRTSAEYVAAHTQFLLHDIAKWRVSDDEDDQDLAEEVQAIHDKLQLVIPKVFPGTNTELTSIYHDDLSSNNIIVDDAGNLAGIIDWECIINAPKWEACQIPSFIAGADDDRVAEPLTEEEMKDEQAVEDHKDLVYNYEATQLKKFFLEEMARVDPQWIQTYKDESTRRDIMLAIEFADNDMYQGRIKGWLNCLLEGRTPKMTLMQSIIDPSGLE
ncbi:hypothetical protein EJ07DRAFT_172035 [Lizonia empirigonia]|nr:hypothetical protein EJ07DRAFT_172035 [Lizonia empirigonia]